MIELYTWGTPNGYKASIMLEECSLPYRVHPVDTVAGEQAKPAFRAVNPNGKIPAIIDTDTDASIFESGAILVYLAEKCGRLLPSTAPGRQIVLQWVFWQVGGVGPMFGQASWFLRKAPENRQAVARYSAEAARLLDVLEEQLGRHEYVAGDDYSIADIMLYPWIAIGQKLFAGFPEELQRPRPKIDGWLHTVGDRTPVRAGMKVPHPHPNER